MVRSKTLYTAPEGKSRRRCWIRVLLVLTCTGVSFFHGSNDGQKGMGLIMLILIGAVPTAYALNRAMPRKRHPGISSRFRSKRQDVSGHAARRWGRRRPARHRMVADGLKRARCDTDDYAALAAAHRRHRPTR